MLLRPVIGKLQHKRVVLASSSPRRREILSNAGLRFEVVPSRFKEKLHKGSFAAPHAYAVETAKQKALEVADRMHQKDLRAPDVVIGADTIVAVGGLILEKPVDKQDAYRMLSRLSGKEHSVFTGVAIVHCCTRDGQLDTEVSEFYEETTVKFSELSEELLWEYIDSGEPMDKAGGYGIQALGGMLVEYVRGDFLNVVGFPLNRFCKELARLYHAPRAPGTPRPVQHDSIPAVDTFEDLSDGEGGGSDPAPASGGLQAGGARPQAPRTQEADLNGVTDSQPGLPAGLLELMDGFKASKVLLTACKLQVFDVLKDRGPLSAMDVAREIDASVGGTARLLDVCAALGLLDKSDRGGSVEKNLPASARDAGSAPESGRSPGGGSGNPLQYSGLESPMDRGARRAAVHGVAESQARARASRCWPDDACANPAGNPSGGCPRSPPRLSDVQGSPYGGPTTPRPFRLQQHGDGQPAPGVRRRAVSPRPGRLPRRARLGRLHAPGPGRAGGGSVDPRAAAAGTPEPDAASHLPSLPLRDWPRAPKASQTRGPSEPVIPVGGCGCGLLGTAWGAPSRPQLPKRVFP
uniref:Acetylserotonin O-methyltransferase like n=1 Tax=Ovis aries TaxID=9940 RepID=A0AC11CSE0_SHEEP